MGVSPIAVYSEADAHAPHVAGPTRRCCLGPAPAAQSYLDIDKDLAAAHATGAKAIHPGYGFLSENAELRASAAKRRGSLSSARRRQQMRDFGLKHVARATRGGERRAAPAGHGPAGRRREALAEAERIGYPVMLKSTAGGGGIGMRPARRRRRARRAPSRRPSGWRGRTSARRGSSSRSSSARARHIEVQVFGDGEGKVVALGERDCSLQRRNQKVIEETPAPGLADERAPRSA